MDGVLKNLFVFGLLVVLGLVGLIFFSNNFFALSQGDSMLPTFSGCTFLVVNSSFLPENLKTGDIVVVDISSQGAEYAEISHRIVENQADLQRFSTRGDNASYYDFPSSIDGYFDYSKFVGRIDSYYILPNVVCN